MKQNYVCPCCHALTTRETYKRVKSRLNAIRKLLDKLEDPRLPRRKSPFDKEKL